tara:strand:+ start:1596 stop:1946 length:351 start_codon:yes stop_codon:yes gene_type:complete
MDEEDFVLFKNKEGAIQSIGMRFDNLFRDNNLPAMVGGGIGSHNKFGSIGIPVGLYMMHSKIKQNDKKIHSRTIDGGVIKDDIYNKLLHLAEQREKKKGKTRKNRKKSKRKTRKMR